MKGGPGGRPFSLSRVESPDQRPDFGRSPRRLVIDPQLTSAELSVPLQTVNRTFACLAARPFPVRVFFGTYAPVPHRGEPSSNTKGSVVDHRTMCVVLTTEK
ncbi:Hypothetical protein GbCGDNIH3_2179 [Granulibacter bethesdensis]|uniref:Uncharacterized protein n=1 Tax=Granulibacter bethesdensis TaxID=364410 RepID=A0AAN0RFG1_9PROT|nr:Hypothetical protein GbCGDNIH3_2179 [Granulibacter bethesdensis]AHJ65336.1 Hypothetical protein GbCGDNIH4_2179 [Granulibacter bethesdensis CGDNIH4]